MTSTGLRERPDVANEAKLQQSDEAASRGEALATDGSATPVARLIRQRFRIG